MREIKAGDWIRLPHYQGGHHWVEAICDEFDWRNGEKMVKARYKTGTLTPFKSLVTGVRKFWPGPTGPVSSLLWKAAKYSRQAFFPGSMLNEASGPQRIEAWHEDMAFGFLSLVADSEPGIQPGENEMFLMFAALLAQEAGY